MDRYARWVTRRAGWVLAAVLLITGLAANELVDPHTGRPTVRIDGSVDGLLPDESAERDTYDRVRLLFGNDETLMVVIEADSVFTPDMLRAVGRISDRIMALDGIRQVLSLTTALDVRGRAGELRIAPLVEEVPEDPAALAAIREAVLSHPLYGGTLASRDGRATALVVHLLDMSEEEFSDRALDREIAAIARREAGSATVYLTGGPHIKAETGRLLLRDVVRTTALATFFVLAVALVSFRSLLGGLLPLLTVGISLIWTLAALVWMGRDLNLVTTILPPLVLCIGFAYAVHVVSETLEHDEAGQPGTSPVAAALSRVAMPVALTALTTLVGFLALGLSPIPAIREFGLFAVVAVAATAINALTLAPALLQLFPSPRRSFRAHARRSGGSREGERIDRWLEAVARFDLRHRRSILWAAAGVALLALFGATRVQVGADLVTNFRADHPVRRDFEAINRLLEGSNVLHVVVEADEEDAFQEPDVLRSLLALQGWLEAQPEVGGTTSLADHLMLLNRAFHDDDPAALRLPDSRSLAAQLLFFGGGEDIERFVDSTYETASIVVRTPVAETRALAELADRIERHLETLPEGLRGEVTGNQVVLASSLADLSRGQMLSLGAAFAFIYGLLALLFTSLRTGAIALLPNALPVLVYFGTLGWMGLTLNPSTSLIACLALGIAVDDSIHLLSRFSTESRRAASEAKGVVRALRAVGRPVTYTTVALCLGFLVLTSSGLREQVQFGLLAAFTLAVAWLLDMTLTPALCGRLRLVTLWDLLTFDLGEEPHKTIALFDGLKPRQARAVALLASMRELRRGERLFREGDAGERLYLVLGGTLVSSIERQGARLELGKMTRGDVVGEGAFFSGRRSTDVHALDDTQMIRLDEAALERVRRRDPNAAAIVYRNLGDVLARRLLNTTRVLAEPER